MTKQKTGGLYEENEMLHIKINAYKAALAEKEIELEQKNDELIRIDAGIKAAYATVEETLHSRTWRYGRKISIIARKVFPPNSRQTRLAARLYKKMRNLSQRRKYGVDKDLNPAIYDFLIPKKQQIPLSFPYIEDPEVSIIIPVHNNYSFTYACLKSILDQCQADSYEIIVADDASQDKTKKIKQYMKSIHVIRNEKPLLFLKNCNQAAAHAKGRFIVFLNNDIVVHKDWLGSMLQIMRQDEKVGIVGSKLNFADGTLQEAGGIIWNDAGGRNYGRGGDPEAPEYCYVKEVDYISGCSIMIRKSIWQEIGGFDERFAPAYYEDADLAFETRKRGYKVVLQPRSGATHFEGMSHGTDMSQGVKAYQDRNKKIFYQKWETTLKSNHYSDGHHEFRARDRTKNKKILLFMDHIVPHFDVDAGSRSTHEYIQLFQSMNYHVIFMPDDFAFRTRYTDDLQQRGVEVLYGDWYAHNYKKWIGDNKDEFDVIFMSRPNISIKYMDFCRDVTDAVILYCGVDLHFLREQRQYELTKDPKLLVSVDKWREIELDLIAKADCALFPSIEEKKYLKNVAGKFRVEVYPVYIMRDVERKAYRKNKRSGLMFIGGYLHSPNKDAMTWFIKDILPRIITRLPDAIIHLYGSHMPDELKQLEGTNVKVHGFVSDDELAGIYASARMTVIPLRYGAGIKGKVVEALNFGLPIVTTSIGAEGFVDADEFMKIENDAEAFADCVCDLYENEAELANMVELGYQYLQREYSVEKAKSVIESAIAMRPGGQSSCI